MWSCFMSDSMTGQMISEIFSPGEDGTGPGFGLLISPEAHDDRVRVASVAPSDRCVTVASLDQTVHDRFGEHA